MIDKVVNSGLNTWDLGGDFKVNSSTFFVDSLNDRVGINTSTPSVPLEIKFGTTNYGLRLFSDDQDCGLSMSDNATSSATHVAMYARGDDLILRAGQSERVRIASDGSVGVGGIATEAKLELMDSTLANFVIHDTAGTKGGVSDAWMKFFASSFETALVGFDGSSVFNILNRDGDVLLGTDSGNVVRINVAATERVRINATGLGIYTTSPANPLDVNGASTLRGRVDIWPGTRSSISLYTEDATAQIADTFAGTTDKSYISFAITGGSNDPGYIMHETRYTGETNEGVLHLCPSDDNMYGDYVSIHGTDDVDRIKFHTDGSIETTGKVYVGDGGTGGKRALSSLTFCTPTRWYHSVTNGGYGDRAYPASTGVVFTIPSTIGGVNTTGITGVMIHVTVVPGVSSGHLILYNASIAAPGVSNINFAANGNPIANTTFVSVNSSRQFKLDTIGGNITFIFDIFGLIFED